ncbi:hypothetical protein BS47DRAFT_1386757 [Hydnum rufescens UP504]|uniref:MIT domain-containing protein n=1 Tax=Hydnum rufescens UP504 TaxID=1448309 RepID=A0A9P6BBL5_9AGAM|nr:hypothetical protein BS47DRAFT_1386757 [Hydnum rufescens UP504]
MNRLKLQESLAEGAPIQRAREHGNLAEQLMAVGKWVEAREHHQSAAKEYQACLKFTRNTDLQGTLRMLYAEHAKAARDLQRKIEENDLEPKQRSNGSDRALPPTPTGSTPPQPIDSSLLRAAVEKRMYTPPPKQQYTSQRNPHHAPPSNDLSTSPSGGRTVLSRNLLPSRLPRRLRVLECCRILKLLKGWPMVEPQDSFSIFFKAIEGMLDKFSQPVPMGVAFASAPLVPTQPPNLHSNGSLSSPTGKKAAPMESDHEDDDSDSDSSFFMIPSSQPSTRSKSDTPSTQYPPPLFQSGVTKPRSGEVRPSLQTLQAENERLHALLSEVTAKLSKAEEVIRAQQEQEQAVRDGVMMVRREVSVRPINIFMNVLLRYAAQRAMAASVSLGRNNSVFAHMPQSLQASLMGPAYVPPLPEKTVTPAVPILDPALDMTTLRRIKELEFQLQALKTDNENQVRSTPFQLEFVLVNESTFSPAPCGAMQRSQIARYRERWQKLKESAKRKQRGSKDSNGDPTLSSGSPEKIVEEEEGTKSDTTLGGDHQNTALALAL